MFCICLGCNRKENETRRGSEAGKKYEWRMVSGTEADAKAIESN